MKRPEEMLKTAELAQQNLPGAPLPGVRAYTASSGEALSVGPAAHSERLASPAVGDDLRSPACASFQQGLLTSSPTAGVAASAAPVLDPSASQDARLGALERTHDLVALHAVRLRETGMDSMRVVIEPGAGLNLSLELRWHKNGIDIHASLDHGDFEYLSRHWGELQQSLEPRGIHLGALEGPNASAGEQPSSQQSERQFTGEEPAPSAGPEFAFSGSKSETPTRPRRGVQTHQGWETWA